MSKPTDSPEARSWSRPGIWSTARRIAVGYIGLVLAVALVNEIAGHPSALHATMTLVAFPGDTVVLVTLIYPLAILVGDDTVDEEVTFNLLTPLLHGAGALVNVLVVWGVIAFARHFRNEARSSRSR
ncbi:hypothetical protein RB201_32715 [Streptomyces sp. S1A(2023)]